MSEDRHYSPERCELARMYPGKKWVKKVSEMSDAQVHAVFVSVRNRKENEKTGKNAVL